MTERLYISEFLTFLSCSFKCVSDSLYTEVRNREILRPVQGGRDTRIFLWQVSITDNNTDRQTEKYNYCHTDRWRNIKTCTHNISLRLHCSQINGQTDGQRYLYIDRCIEYYNYMDI